MQHVKPTSKGDPLCPLGFHPQVRWPTRCKRCFRDYKEHGNRNKEQDSQLRKDELTVSTPTLSSYSSRSRNEPKIPESTLGTRTWTSSSNLSSLSVSSKPVEDSYNSRSNNTTSSWTSSPNLAEAKEEPAVTTVSLTLPRRRSKPPEEEKDDDDARRTEFTIRRRTVQVAGTNTYEPVSSYRRASTPTTKVTTPNNSSTAAITPTYRTRAQSEENKQKSEVDFMLQVKAASKAPLVRATKSFPTPQIKSSARADSSDSEDDASVTNTDTTETTIVNENQEEIESLKKELEVWKSRCEKAEREKSDFLMRRLTVDPTSTRTSSSEVLKLQQKVNELKANNEDLRDEKKSLGQKVRELEADLEGVKASGVQKEVQILRDKLNAAESLCEELMDVNEEMKKEIRDMEEEMDEMQDKFREDRADEYTSLKKELEQATKNCRILSFKLRKAERRAEQLDAEKLEAERKCREAASRLQKDLEEANSKLKNTEKDKSVTTATQVKKKAPKLGSLSKTSSGEKMSRESLTRGDSQEDPVQLLRDLQDSLEREADLREQLRYAEEEILRLQVRKKVNKCTPDIIPIKLTGERKYQSVKEGLNFLGLDSPPELTTTAEDLEANAVKGVKQDMSVQNEEINYCEQFTQTEIQEHRMTQTEEYSAIEINANNTKWTQCDPKNRDVSLQTESFCGLPTNDSVDRMTQTNPSSSNSTSQTIVLDMNPCLHSKLLPFGSLLPHSHVLSPLGALFLPLLARRPSPSQRLTPEPVEKDEGISDDDDPSELRIQLELNEQEASVLRRKVKELEGEGERLKKKVKELQDTLNSKSPALSKKALLNTEPSKSNAVYEQKMKVLEEEMSELRLKLIEKGRECERLHAEISLATKKPKTLQKSKSLDADPQTVDLKRQLQVIETEANILRTKTQTLESENEKLMAENKKLSLLSASKRASSVERLNDSKGLEKQLEESNRKIKELEAAMKPIVNKDEPIPIAEMEKLKTQLKKSETERKKHEDALKRLREQGTAEAASFYKSRTPKKPTETSTKLQLKRMVEEVENEMSELMVVLKKMEEEKTKEVMEKTAREMDALKAELESTKSKLSRLTKDEKDLNAKKEKDLADLNKTIKDLENDKVKLKKDADKYKASAEKEKQKLQDSQTEFVNTKKDLTTEIEKLKQEIKQSALALGDIDSLKKKISSLTDELDEEKKQTETLEKQLDTAKKTGAASTKLTKETEDKTKKIEELEKKVRETEEKLKKAEKLGTTRKEKLTKLEKENSELNKKMVDIEKEKETLNEETKSLKTKFEESESKIKSLEEEVETKSKEIKKLEKGVHEKEDAVKETKTTTSKATKEISQLKEELASAKASITELTDKITKTEQELKTSQEEMAKKEKLLQKEIDDWEKKASELEMDLQEASGESAADRKMMDRLKAAQEKEIKAKDIEIAQLRTNALTANNKKIQEMQTQIDNLDLALESEKREYDELTNKYEQLEEEHVIMKATLVKEKEKVQNELIKTENDLVDIEGELKALRETYNSKQDNWIKEKLKLEEKLKETETLSLEKTRLQAFCDEKQSEIDQLKKESQGLTEQIEYMRKESEDLRKQVEDYDKVSKVQRSMTADVTSLEEELKEYKTKLVLAEKARKTDVAKMKMRYDQRISVIQDEMLSLQGQVARFKRERDSYRHMMEAAQRNISELKASGLNSGTISSRSSTDGDDLRTHVAQLEQQISCLEDELSESRIEASRLRTELVSERSAWEVKLSELNSKLNELEEEKILSSGRTKISGLKTRMELAWQKEREEQHRLLQETSTLARDLRQTLFEVERERDRERLESKRRLDQLKKTNEEEQEEIRKKLTEMQCDLLELRDAHAKLRTTNEKLRREKDKNERERELLRQSLTMKKRAEQEEERQIISVYQLVEELTVLAPDLFPSKPKQSATMPTPPIRRKGPKSREASPNLERKDYSRESSVGREDAKTHEVQEIMKRLTEAANQLRKCQTEEKESERTRRSFSSYRSSSIESDGGVESLNSVKRRNLQKKGPALRKSLSLEQTSAQEEAIWSVDDEGSMTSVQSLEEMEKFRRGLHMRDPSLDSRLSGGSTQSEVLPSSDKKKKLGLFGKLKKLTKSRSIDHDSEMGSTGHFDPGSDTSLADDKSNRQFKDKFSGMFKKSGSTSRGNSVERSLKPPPSPKSPSDSTQRPLVSSSSSVSGERPLTKKPPSTAPVQRKAKK
ncbi:uncharacterized protein isoform X3 [Rhodnius prolixus]|uniref:uncharacterized protein isoform X3 n=1 Tax=Rhodnius prolixus TaxID=13249 RepID=UPI003D18B9CD